MATSNHDPGDMMAAGAIAMDGSDDCDGIVNQIIIISVL
jgi:hypothetical protein